jgi:hypothetical protein
MAKRPEKKRDGKGDAQPPLPTSSTARILPMQLQVGDRLTDETGEYEIIGRPSTTNAGKDAHVRSPTVHLALSPNPSISPNLTRRCRRPSRVATPHPEQKDQPGTPAERRTPPDAA